MLRFPARRIPVLFLLATAMVAHPRSEQSVLKRRMEALFLLFILGVLVLACRLVYLQWFQSRGFLELANRMQGRRLEIDARRGRIQDRNGAELATDVLGKAIAINPRVVKDPARTAARLAELLALAPEDAATVRERLDQAVERRRFYCQLRRGVDRHLAEKILEGVKTDPALRGLWLEDSPVRVNPCGADAIQLVGAVNMDGRGVEAIELAFDRVLHGANGERLVRVDATGKPIPKSETRMVEPVDGRDVRLTLDRDIQHFVEAELAKVAEAQTPDAAAALVMDVTTGQVLAMASWPSYDPRQRIITPAQRRNRAITDLFEPGSTFKIFTAAAALEFGVSTQAYCSGSRAIGKWRVGCAKGARHGAVDMRRMVAQSCNLAAGTLAERIGAERLHAFLVRLGFQDRTGIEYPGEAARRIRRPDKWRTIGTVNIGFGQGISLTPIQLLAACNAIANDGIYVPPRLVLEAPGAELPARVPRRVMTAEHAATLRGHMEAAVTSGTGKAAKIPGYSVGGKTGTAQIAMHGRYGHGYVASFVGFLPAQKPRLSILVSVWHPRKQQYGGVVAAPAFREIARQSVAYLKVEPDAPADLRDGAHPGSFARVARGGGGHD